MKSGVLTKLLTLLAFLTASVGNGAHCKLVAQYHQVNLLVCLINGVQNVEMLQSVVGVMTEQAQEKESACRVETIHLQTVIRNIGTSLNVQVVSAMGTALALTIVVYVFSHVGI